MKISGPQGEVDFTREFCLQKAAYLLYSADANLTNNSNSPLPHDFVSSGMAGVQAQAQLAQAYMMLHDRLPESRGFEH